MPPSFHLNILSHLGPNPQLFKLLVLGEASECSTDAQLIDLAKTICSVERDVTLFEAGW